MSKKWNWDNAGDDATTMMQYGEYYAETYEEIDNSYSVTIRKDDPVDGEKIYYREDLDCLHTAHEIAEIIIENARLREELKDTKVDRGRHQSKL